MSENPRRGSEGAPEQAPVRILLIGSRPPPLGGSTVLFAQLARELEAHKDVEIDILDTSRAKHAGGVFREIRHYLALPARVRWADVVSLHASTRGLTATGLPLALLCRSFRRPLVMRVFGGSLARELDTARAALRTLLLAGLKRSHVLVETRALVTEMSNRYGLERCYWYSNSRPLLTGKALTAPPSAYPRFVFVGHVKANKGIPELLAATSRSESAAYEVDVYGPLQHGFEPEELREHPHVHYRGSVDPADVPSLLQQYWAVVLPSYHSGEGYPGILLEAYSAGVPIIATRWGGIEEILEHGGSGLLVPPRSSEALRDALTSLSESPELRERLARGARERAAEFASELWTERFVEICWRASREARLASK